MSIRNLSKELQEKAQNELNEIPERIQEDINHIKDWLTKQPHLNSRTDDQWLLSFLRGCKFSLEKTKQRLDAFYTIKTLAPEFFANQDPYLPNIQEILNLGSCLPLPKKDETSATPTFILFRNGVINPYKHDVTDIIKTYYMILHILLNEDDNFIIAGSYGVYDSKDTILAHMLNITPTIAKKSLTCIQYGYPLRLKGLYLFNTPSYFEILYNIVRPFFNEKTKKRMNVFSNQEGIQKVVPLEILPKEYGGQGNSVHELRDEWKRKVESYRDRFLEDERYCTDEALRLGKAKTVSDVFGVEGSFRKMHFD